MIGRCRVRFHAGEYGILVGEAREVVDVAIGVVAFDSFFEPKDFGNTKFVTQQLFGLFAGEMGIAVGVEEDRLGGEQLAASVDFDGSAFEDHAAFEDRKMEGGCDVRGDGVVEVPWFKFSTPCVEFPIGDGDFPGGFVFDEDGAVVSAPDVVVGMRE